MTSHEFRDTQYPPGIRDDPNKATDFAGNILRFGSDASRQCRGISAAGHPKLVFLLGCHHTLMGALAILHAPDAIEKLDVMTQATNLTATSLMATLRTYAFQRPIVHAPAPRRDADPHDAMSAGPEILPEKDWLANTDSFCEVTEELLVDSTAGLTPAQVYAHLDVFSDGAAGDWLLGRLEALTGLQAALAIASASGRSTRQRVALLRTALGLQCESTRQSLQPLVDAANTAHPFLQATCETLFVEGLSANEPRLIVMDGMHASNGKSSPG